jgi:3-isopropylmalate dehydrogenase
MILAAKMMLDWLSERHEDSKCLAAAQAVEEAVTKTLRKGITVPDFGGKVKTVEMAEAIAEEVLKSNRQVEKTC